MSRTKGYLWRSAVYFVFICLLFGNTVIAQADIETAHKECTQDLNGELKVKVGLFVSSLYNLDFKRNSYGMDFWIWWKYDNQDDAPREMHPDTGEPVFIPYKQIEIINKKFFELEKSYQQIGDDGSVYVMAKFNAEINQKWNFSDFPFDTQKIVMELESVEYDTGKLDFVVDDDLNDMVVSDDVQFANWTVEPLLRLETCDKKYESSFGGESPGVYSRIKMTASLTRNIDSLLFFDIYLGFFLAFIMCTVLYFLELDNLASRIGVIFAATISAIGQKQILQSSFPNSIDSDLSNVIETATFSFIFITLLCSITCNKIVKSGTQANEVLAGRIHWSTFAIIVIAYLYFVGANVVSR